MKIKTTLLAVLCACFNSSFATALANTQINSDYENVKEDDYFDDFYGSAEMVEIATGIKTQIYKAPAVATVISAEQIKNLGATDIDDILETVPGLHITLNATNYQPIYSFRGVHSIYNPQVLMLINGIPITNNFLGNRNQNWLGMPVEAIARVEVIRGPGSAVFGSDAFSGVINIITKSADDINETQVAIRAGSYNTKDAWFSMSNKEDDLKYALVFEYHNTDGFDQIIEADAQTRLDGIFGTNVSNAPGELSLGVESFDVRTEVNYQQLTIRTGLQRRTNGGLGIGLAEALDPIGNKASTRWNFDINYKSLIDEHLTLDWQASYFSTSQEIKNNYYIYPAGVQLGAVTYPEGFIGNPEVWEKHYRLNVTALYTGIDHHTIRLGVGYHNGDMYKTKESKNFGLGPDGELLPEGSPVVDVSDTPFMFLRETDRTNKYGFMQDVWALANDWELTAGVRFDDYSDFGSTANPRLALVWSTTLNLSTKMLYGKAFRAPSFAELGNINNPVALGNPDLTPEEMETFELAFDYHPLADYGAVISFYRYKWSDIIQFVADENASSNTAKNFGEQAGYGMELELNWQISKEVKLASNYSISKATNDLTNDDVAFVPQSQLYFQLDWKLNNEHRLHLRSHWVMDRERDQADLRETIDDYFITNLTYRWLPQDSSAEYSLIAKNIFDVDAREPSINSGATVKVPYDLPLMGLSLFAEVRVAF